MFRAIAGLALVAALCVGCSSSPVVLITDNYWNALLAHEGDDQTLRAAAGRGGHLLEVKTVDTEGNLIEEMSGTVRDIPATLYVLSPLLAPFAGRLAGEFPGRRFLVPAVDGETGAKPPNLTFFRSDSLAAFSDAGVLTSKFVADTNSGSSVVTLVPDDAAAGSERAKTFVGSLAREIGPSSIRSLAVGSPADLDAVRTFLTQSRAMHPAVYVLLAPDVTAYALDLLKDDATPLVVENWISGADYDEKVAVAIDEEPIQPLAKTLEILRFDADDQASIPWKVVSRERAFTHAKTAGDGK